MGLILDASSVVLAGASQPNCSILFAFLDFDSKMAAHSGHSWCKYKCFSYFDVTRQK